MAEIIRHKEIIPVKLDQKDKKLIYELDFHSRDPCSKLSKRVNLSKQGVEYKINNLIKKGVIKGFYPVINVPKLGFIYCRLLLTLQSATEKDKDKIKQKITHIHGDYRCAFYQREVFRSNPHGTDYTLGIHSGEDGNILIPAAKQITKGKMIFAYEQDFNLGEKFTPEEQIGIRGSVINSEFGFYNLTSKILDWHKDTEDKTIIFFECHKPE